MSDRKKLIAAIEAYLAETDGIEVAPADTGRMIRARLALHQAMLDAMTDAEALADFARRREADEVEAP